jgi:hypothetical protein
MPTMREFVDATFQDEEEEKLATRDVGDSLTSPDGSSVVSLVRDIDEDIDTKVSEGIAPPGMKCEAKRLYSKEGSGYITDWVDEIPDKLMDPEYGYGGNWGEFALLLRTRLIQGQQRLHSVVIQSPLLKYALNKIFAGYPGFFVGNTTLEVESPFTVFVHRWDALVRACEGTYDLDTARHLRLLKTALEIELEETFTTIKDFKTHGGIEFEQLWTVFKPRILVFSNGEGTECAYKVMRTEYSVEDGKRYLFVHCCRIDFDGNMFGYALHVFAVPLYQGVCHFSDLNVYPLDCHPDRDALIRRLVERGRKFESYADVLYRAYDGMASDNTGISPKLRRVRDRC